MMVLPSKSSASSYYNNVTRPSVYSPFLQTLRPICSATGACPDPNGCLVSCQSRSFSPSFRSRTLSESDTSSLTVTAASTSRTVLRNSGLRRHPSQVSLLRLYEIRGRKKRFVSQYVFELKFLSESLIDLIPILSFLFLG